MRVRRDDRGAATVEYAGILFVVLALLLSVLVAVTPVGYAIMAKICEAMGGDCSSLGPDLRAAQLKVPCVVRQTDRTLGYNVNVQFVRAERKDTDQIRTSSDGTSTVTVTQGGGLGLEAAQQSGGKAVDAKARVTANGDLGYVYVFPEEYGGEQAAQEFLADRRGGLDQAVDIVVPGAQTAREGINQAGQAVSNGWDWLTTKAGHGPSQEERAQQAAEQAATTPDALQLALSLQGSAGASIDGGLVKGGAEVSGQVKGAVVAATNHDGPDASRSSFTGSAQFDVKGDLTLGVPGDDQRGLRDLPPILNITGSYGKTVSYQVFFDEDGEPVLLVLAEETRSKAGLGLNPPKVGSGTKVGGKAGVDAGDLVLETSTLDLADEENRAAFDEFFVTYGVDAGDVHAMVADIPLDGGLAGVAERWDAVQRRLDADAFEATYEYRQDGDALNATAGENAYKAGGWGVGGDKTTAGRELVGAVARDNRYGGAEVPLATCEG